MTGLLDEAKALDNYTFPHVILMHGLRGFPLTMMWAERILGWVVRVWKSLGGGESGGRL
ncbi:MAG: hypothetical protein QXE96_01560 [Candidatus Caldarchaeum sp.]